MITHKHVKSGLHKLNEKSIVFRHLPQFKVNRQYSGKVFAIDVK